MKILFGIRFVFSLLLVSASQSLVANPTTEERCYSIYHLEQRLKLRVNLGEAIQNQNISMDMDIHVRELASTKEPISRNGGKAKGLSLKEIRVFTMLIKPNFSKVNGVELELAQRYAHPFLIYANAKTGELIDLKSTVNDQSIINEYLSFFDLFQYAKRSGSYRYRNGNGFYKAEIQNLNSAGKELTKVNTGYINEDNKLKIRKSHLSIVTDENQSNCFYQSSQGVESFKTILSKQAFVEGDATVKIVADKNRRLKKGHFFFTLNDHLDSWPGFEKVKKISQQQAFIKIPFLMTKLSALIENKPEFLSAMRSEKSTWPFLVDYMLVNNIDEELSYKIFWALDRINTTESVSALAKISISTLPKELLYRAILAFSSTTAPLDSESFEMIKSHIEAMSELEFNSQESLLLVRVLGALAKRQSEHSPIQSNQIREFLYSQVDSPIDIFAASVIEAIGNLKDGIDEDGVDILINGLDTDSKVINQSALQALIKIPYNSDYTELYVSKLTSARHPAMKGSIIDLLGNSPKTDSIVKIQLLSIVSKSTDLIYRKKSLNSLRKIGYNFQVDDVDLLKSQLRRESDKTNQKLLAALILKSRR